MLLGWDAGAEVLPQKDSFWHGFVAWWLQWAVGGLRTPVPHTLPTSAASGGILIKGLVTWLWAWTLVK